MELTARDYRLIIDGNKVTVKQGKSVIAETSGRWAERSERARYKTVVLNPAKQLEEIRFEGQRKVLIFDSN